MTLKALPNYPSGRCYVLKIHRDAAPRQHQIFGRLEHVDSGTSVEFMSAEALLQAIADQIARAETSPWPAPAGPGPGASS